MQPPVISDPLVTLAQCIEPLSCSRPAGMSIPSPVGHCYDGDQGNEWYTTHDNCEGNCIVTKYLEVTLASHSVSLVFLQFDTGGPVT